MNNTADCYFLHVHIIQSKISQTIIQIFKLHKINRNCFVLNMPGEVDIFVTNWTIWMLSWDNLACYEINTNTENAIWWDISLDIQLYPQWIKHTPQLKLWIIPSCLLYRRLPVSRKNAAEVCGYKLTRLYCVQRISRLSPMRCFQLILLRWLIIIVCIRILAI